MRFALDGSWEVCEYVTGACGADAAPAFVLHITCCLWFASMPYGVLFDQQRVLTLV